MRILVIDDDLSVGAAIRTLLSRASCEVVFVHEGMLGLQPFFDETGLPVDAWVWYPA